MLHHLLINGLFPEETAQLPLHFDNSAPCCSWGKDAEFRWYVMVLAAICGTFFPLVQNANTHWYSTGEALLAFKKAVTNSDGVFLNWREQDADPCNWKGVRCDSHSKRVINL